MGVDLGAVHVDDKLMPLRPAGVQGGSHGDGMGGAGGDDSSRTEPVGVRGVEFQLWLRSIVTSVQRSYEWYQLAIVT